MTQDPIARRLCEVVGCGRPHDARGLCSMHRRRWAKHGDVNVVKKGGAPKRQRGQCGADGCALVEVTSGLCGTHYRRWRRYGSDRPCCTVDGCDGAVTARGLCELHYNRWLRHGDPLCVKNRRVDRPCAIAGCDRLAEVRAMCYRHYNRWLRNGDPVVEVVPELATGLRNGAHTRPEQVRRGEQVGTAKLTTADVQTIRRLYATGDFTQYQLADMFGLGQPQVGCIIRRVAWRHVA